MIDKQKQLKYQLTADLRELAGNDAFLRVMARLFQESYLFQPTSDKDPDKANAKQIIQSHFHKYFAELRDIAPISTINIIKIYFNNIKQE